jgi:hypothetical protein
MECLFEAGKTDYMAFIIELRNWKNTGPAAI